MTTRFFARQRTIEGASDRLGKDLRSAVDDANYLLKDMANTTAEEFASAATRISEKVAEARDRFDDARLAVSKKARVAAEATQEYVLDNPWKVIGVAAAVGLIIGVFASNRR